MTLSDLYNLALANRAETGERYGAARYTLSNGDVLVCSVSSVAGRSIISKHDRQMYVLVKAGDQYGKQISRKKAAALLSGL